MTKLFVFLGSHFTTQYVESVSFTSVCCETTVQRSVFNFNFNALFEKLQHIVMFTYAPHIVLYFTWVTFQCITQMKHLQSNN